MDNFIILTDSACDLPKNIIIDLEIKELGLICNINNKEYIDDINSELTSKEFYNKLKEGAMPSTSQINSFKFVEYFEEYVKKGIAILYLAFSSALSGTYNSSLIARNELLEQYPEAKIEIIDTRAACLGQGLIVYYAAKMRKEGKSLEEISNWVEENKNKTCHFFTVDNLDHLKRGGRISPTAAAIGSLLNIKPMLYTNDKGELHNFSKAKGRKRAIKNLYELLDKHIVNPEEQTIFIAHSDCIEDAEKLAEMIKEKYNVKEIIIDYIGIVIGSHTGIGTLALFFLGDTKEP
ncbi:DegV family protein [Clostridium sp.]|uniref:DegV family protein n=1 Tax=Clostridium sp. TaxID=1506 RepID=UPI0026055DA0|nr:DegV family protein [Clostridium sp.]